LPATLHCLQRVLVGAVTAGHDLVQMTVLGLDDLVCGRTVVRVLARPTHLLTGHGLHRTHPLCGTARHGSTRHRSTTAGPPAGPEARYQHHYPQSYEAHHRGRFFDRARFGDGVVYPVSPARRKSKKSDTRMTRSNVRPTSPTCCRYGSCTISGSLSSYSRRWV